MKISGPFDGTGINIQGPYGPRKRLTFLIRRFMVADFYINMFLDADKLTKVEGAGLGGQVQEIEGKKAIQVPVTAKEHKKLSKSFPDMKFDASNAAVLPEQAEDTLMGFVVSLKSIDVMKVAISKLFSPLAGKELRSKV